MRVVTPRALVVAYVASGCPSAPPATVSADTTSGTDGTATTSSSTTAMTTEAASTHGDVDTVRESDGSVSDATGSAETCGTAGCSAETDGASTASTGDSEGIEVAYRYTVLDAGQSTAIMGGPDSATGAVTFYELCPFDDVLVGVVLWARSEASGSNRAGAPMGLAAHCASILLADVEDSSAVSLGYDEVLLRRGHGYPDDVEQTLDCPDGHAVVGFEGVTGAYVVGDPPVTVHYVNQLALHCAPLARDGDNIVFGEAVVVTAMGTDGHANPVAFEPEHCLEGQLARGVVVGAGHWVDSFGLWCATPRLRWSTGGACRDGLDCAFGPCDEGHCADRPCLPSHCYCVLFRDRSYAFCPEAPDYDVASTACASDSMTMVRIEDGPEGGWIHTTSHWFELGPQMLGATDRAVEGEWTWPDGTLFWNGAAVDDLFSAWSTDQPDNADPGQHCAVMGSDGRWTDEDCAGARAFVCEESASMPPE